VPCSALLCLNKSTSPRALGKTHSAQSVDATPEVARLVEVGKEISTSVRKGGRYEYCCSLQPGRVLALETPTLTRWDSMLRMVTNWSLR